MRRLLILSLLVIVASMLTAMPSAARDRPFGSATLNAFKLWPSVEKLDNVSTGISGSNMSKVRIENFRCTTSGNPGSYVDISCNTPTLGQNYSPDNELAIAVDPEDSDHLLAGSNDYYYRFNNSTGGRQAIVPTGFFTSFDGGATWLDGQIPMRSGNGAGDPAPAFDGKHDVALMAQLENVGGQGGPYVSQGDVSISHSRDGGIRWTEPVTVMKGTGTGIGPANQAVFWDKVYIAVDNNPGSPWYGRIYVTATRFLNALHGSFAESPIYLSYSDDGGVTWTNPEEISGSHPSCTFQSVPPFSSTDCDEDQNSIPEVAADGTLYVYFANYQNEAEWEQEQDFDAQIMVVRSDDGGQTFGDPVPTAQLENGFSDLPFSVIGRQTVWGHQIRWSSDGNISVNPNDPDDVTVIYSGRADANANATPGCFLTASGGVNIGTAPNYDPCDAGPGSDLDVFISRSLDGGETWTASLLDDGDGNSQWFPWADHKSDGTLVVAWDEDTAPAPADTFKHVLWNGSSKEALGPAENVDVSLTHWAGQYTTAWPAACGPAGYSDPPVVNAEGKDCNVFHGDYTGLVVDSDDRIHVVWTGLNRQATSPQVDFYTGEYHDGYAQDAMYARR